MGFWNKLYSGIGQKEIAEKPVEKAIQAHELPMTSVPLAMASGKVSPIDSMFKTGISASVLREFSVNYPVLRMCVDYKKRQIEQLAWNITSTEVIADKEERKKVKEKAMTVRDFFRHPTGNKSSSFSNFLGKILEDLFILDAMAIYRRRNRRGGIYGYLPVDASTIRLGLLEDGTTPEPPLPAYYQKVRGQITGELTTDDLIYRMINPRTYTPYGLSPVESLIITITTGLKLSSYQLSYLTAGNIPEGFVELPKEVASNPDQLLLWQNAWDAMFAGNSSNQRKIKFLPEGMKLHEIKKQDEMSFERFEKWILQNVCGVMGVPPQAIGFQFDRGKGATEAEWEIGKEKGLFPIAKLLKEIFDDIIQNDLGQKDLEFTWTNINPTNKKEESQVFADLVRYGAVSVDEWRVAEGYEPIGLGHYVQTSTGVVLVEDIINRTTSTLAPDAQFIQDNKGTMPMEAEPVSIVDTEQELVEDTKEKPSGKKPEDVPLDPKLKQPIEPTKETPTPTKEATPKEEVPPKKKKPEERPKAEKMEKSESVYEYQSLQLNIPDGELKKISEYQSTINEEDLSIDKEKGLGGLEDESHITVLFGLDDSVNKTDISSIVSDIQPVTATLGKVKCFENDDTDVLYVEIIGNDIIKLNSLIKNSVDTPGQTFSDYVPHMTLAYLKKGTARKYVGDDYFTGTTISFDTLYLSDKMGDFTPIKLESNTKASRINDLRKWKRAVLNDLKRGKEFRKFESNYIDYETKESIMESLSFAINKFDVEEVFAKALNPENDMMGNILELSNKVNKVLNSNK